MTYILGAGMTGLSAAIKTGYPIFEATDKAGGICRSYNKDGFEFSTGGGHWLFGNVDFVKSLVPLNTYERKAGIYYNTIFPYPFQTFASQELEEYKGDWTPQYLKGSLVSKFGKEQCNLFFHPFNEKYTAGLYDKIIQVDDYKSPPAGGKGFCSQFYDPEGGLNSLVKAMASKCDIHYNTKAISLRANDKVLIVDNGSYKSQIMYNRLISTIPLNTMMKLCGQECNLPYTSVLVLNIGAEPAVNTPTEHWLYVPFCKSGFYRVGFYSNVNKRYAPEGKVGLSVEMAFYNTKYKDLDIQKICQDVCVELAKWNWIKQVITIDPTFVECAYTWLYDRKDREDALAWLRERDIISIGRYGNWVFTGMLGSIEQGFNVEI